METLAAKICTSLSKTNKTDKMEPALKTTLILKYEFRVGSLSFLDKEPTHNSVQF